MTDINAFLRDEMRRHMATHELTNAATAAAIGIHYSTLSLWLSEKRPYLRGPALDAVAHYLHARLYVDATAGEEYIP